MKRFLSALIAACLGAIALAAHAGPEDAAAQKALTDAVETDYLQMRFDAAEQKLRGALTKCGAAGCTPGLRAKLLVALGGVLASGKKQLSDAKDVFVEALTIDAAIQPNPDLASSEAAYAFDLAKKELKVPTKPAPALTPTPPPKPVGSGVDGDICDQSTPCRDDFVCRFGTCKVRTSTTEPPPDEPAAKPARKNWFTLMYSPDVSLVSGSNVCTPSSRTSQHYVCLRPDRTNYVGTPTLNNADDINTGLAAGTMRVTLGYERIIGDNFGVGARGGFQFNGIAVGPDKPLPIHAEARVAYYVGKKPFSSLGVRPAVFLAGGVSEVNGNSDIEVLEDGNACGAVVPADTHSPCTKPTSDGVVQPRIQTLSAYRRLGPGFAGGGFELSIAPADGVAFNLGLRVAATFPVVALVLAPEAGFALGF